MPETSQTISVPERLSKLRRDIEAQGRRVLELLLRAVDSYFDDDREKAQAVVAGDDLVDRVDVEIERASIGLLGDRLGGEHEIRLVVTIVKVNNELERVADLAVNIAEAVIAGQGDGRTTASTFRVMANSVIGMLRDANRALADGNLDLATQVLRFDDTVDRFKVEILRDTRERVDRRELAVGIAFRLLAVTKALERIADHCTNICEQVIYLQSGKIVRHRPEGWSEPEAPQA
ncbi:MAG: phosphate signaling complex protein PhoU [Phycisphaerae bacterium]|nr:phosphate signaling complex protein PhoU [Phycisphaerae bacterium]